MKTRRDYDRAIQAVREVIHRWDPYGLLAGGSPLDEFDAEIAALVAQVPRIRSRADAAHALSRVFSSAFEPERFRPEDCIAAGTELFEALSAAGLLEA
ncbi:MAG TPA: hypothetical protein VGF55_09815 [Gemmataceae bacterium]|jgi:hypothetical protein